MSATPAVAIITPTHNHEQYIGACLESVLAQTRGDWEMVIVDDGSRDRTLEIARGYDDPRIRVRAHARARGLERLGEAYREALDATAAPLVAILEGDDTRPPDKLRVQLPHFEASEVVLAYGAAGEIDSEGCRYGTYRRHPPDSAAENRPIGSILPHLLGQNFIVAATVVVRRAALEDVGGFWQPAGIPTSTTRPGCGSPCRRVRRGTMWWSGTGDATLRSSRPAAPPARSRTTSRSSARSSSRAPPPASWPTATPRPHALRRLKIAGRRGPTSPTCASRS